MPDGGGFDSGEDTAPIDYDVLDRLGHRLAGSERFEDVEYRPDYAPNSVVLRFDLGYFPVEVERASLQVRWYENDDFSFHYAEQWEGGDRWECRWDRHPNTHNSRDHFHPPSDAATPGTDASYSQDWREMVIEILDELDAHIKAFWA
ncbi:hypothetical protein [Halococcus sp. IIIV-5B]|uniref:hypothetical protein n=1 Tax=Halococcus sp. IIIV-5B TaxID=2321230 RepID=UPI000E7416E8|nr:hypothetical protein [Halococcus sp. IIIV-5B]RJT07499.1 hypothetical protein D3261_02545 [Halococcus sp. IIIV-5B]